MPLEMLALRTFPKLSKSLKIVKVTYVKRIPKHEPTSSYYDLVGFIAECMLRWGEDNQHVHGGYAE